MSSVKVVFIGNPLGGDDGIGPYLYTELQNHPVLQTYELMELGVIGLDLLSYVQDGDMLIIVDAVRSTKDVGKVVLLEEEDLSNDVNLISQHDFGVEQTAAIIRAYIPGVQKINIIGIQVKTVTSF
jgi:hydrogenase maturation protease